MQSQLKSLTTEFYNNAIVSGIVSIVLMPVLNMAYGWVVENKNYLLLTIAFITIDLILGLYVHAFVKKDFSLEKMATKFLKKLFITFIGLLLFELFKMIFFMNNIDINKWFKLTIALTVLNYPLLSAIENLYLASNGKIPPKALYEKFKKFNDTLNINEFTNLNNKEKDD